MDGGYIFYQFLVLLLVMAIAAVVWFLAAGLFWLIVILGAVCLLALSPWIVKGFLESWRGRNS
jgi:hypothetical protein